MNNSLLLSLRDLARKPPPLKGRVAACLYVAGIGRWVWPGGPTQAAAARALRLSLSELDVDTRHYAAATLYSLMLGHAKRRRLAAYFTPPRVVQHTIGAAAGAGLRLNEHSVVDPAAGGAAFLSSLAGRMRDAGVGAREVRTRLFGIELDPGLALLANKLIDARLGTSSGRRVVKSGDAFTLWDSKWVGTFDGVVANPPYGRITGPRARKLGAMAELVDPAHVNRYALFAGLSVRLARAGGVVALVIPTSFLSGPLFGPLRRHLRTNCTVSSIDLIADRDNTFVDVSQDTCVLLLRKSVPHRPVIAAEPACSIIMQTGDPRPAAIPAMPHTLEAPWTLPSERTKTEFAGSATLEDYGISVRAGYFVWNREKHRMRTSKRGRVFPLIWACNVSPGEPCIPVARTGSGIDFVRFDEDSSGIQQESAIVLQRTTNNRQPRRLVGAMVPDVVLEQYGGFVSENHTLVLSRARQDADLRLALALISTQAVDERYRRIAVGSHVSVTALRALPLPDPVAFRRLYEEVQDAERAAQLAYAECTDMARSGGAVQKKAASR